MGVVASPEVNGISAQTLDEAATDHDVLPIEARISDPAGINRLMQFLTFERWKSAALCQRPWASASLTMYP